jgi:hypothetical protein
VVKNVGGFALGISLLGILFFPIGLLGAGIGIYVLTMLRGPLGRYSGRRAAMAAVAIGSVVFLGEGAFAMNWLKARRVQRIKSVQASVSEDLRALLRAQRLFRATHDTYGTFREFRFRPPVGSYTVYLGADDLVAATREEVSVTDPLPDELYPVVTEAAFTAIAVANLDGDMFLDVWSLNDHGTIAHLRDDASNQTLVEPGSAGVGELTLPGEPPPESDVPAVAPEPSKTAPTPQPMQVPKPTQAPRPTPAPASAPEVAPAPPATVAPDAEPAEVGPEPGLEPGGPSDPVESDVKSIDELLDSAP